MLDQNNNPKLFNLPSYINIPQFLYQDHRLEKSATLIAAFFYSIHTAGQKMTASPDYLCQLTSIHRRQYFNILNLLEACKYIKRSGHTNRQKIEWIYQPNSQITVEDLDITALECTNVQDLNTNAMDYTKLVQYTALNWCTPVHTYNKENTKVSKKTSTTNPKPQKPSSEPPTASQPPQTSETPVSSLSFSFSSKQQNQILDLKLSQDLRSNSEFLGNALHHIQNNSKPELHVNQRVAGLIRILMKCKANGELFKSKGYSPEPKKEERIPTREDFENYKNFVPGYEWVWTRIQELEQLKRA